MWLGSCRLLSGLPSPKFHEYVYGPVPPDADPTNETPRGADPDVGFPLAEADRLETGLVTVITTEPVAVSLIESVAVRVAVKVPAPVY